jgi:hypothetical protein
VGLGPHARGWTAGYGEDEGGTLPWGGSTLLVRRFAFMTVGRDEDEGGALPWGGSMLLVRRFAFMTVGRGEDEGGALPRGGSTLLVRRFAFFALEDQHASCMTYGAAPHVIGWIPRCASGETSRDVSRRKRGNLPLKGGFIPRVAAMPCFSPTRGDLSPLSSLCPFAFKVFSLRCHSLPWPCKFIPSMPRLSECSTWYTACLDGMGRRLAEGFAPAPSTLVNLPLESSCLLSSPVGWCCWSCLSSVGGARPCGSGALPPVLGFKDVHQPRSGGERAEPRLRLPYGLVTRLFLQHSEEKDDHQPCEGGELQLRGPGQTASTACRCAPSSMAWMVLSSPP